LRYREKIYVLSAIAEGRKKGSELQKLERTGKAKEGRENNSEHFLKFPENSEFPKISNFPKFPRNAIVIEIFRELQFQ